jgi:hypothetical protein
MVERRADQAGGMTNEVLQQRPTPIATKNEEKMKGKVFHY